MLVYGSAEPLWIGDSVAVDGHLRLAGRGRIFGAGGMESLDGCGIKKVGLELRGIRPNTDPVPVTLREYCETPERFAGNLIQVHGILHVSLLARAGKDCFMQAGDGQYYTVLYVDGDTGIEMDPEGSGCYTITGISMKMHVPAGAAAGPAWCLAPRCQDDVIRDDCSTLATLSTWGGIKAAFSQ